MPFQTLEIDIGETELSSLLLRDVLLEFVFTSAQKIAPKSKDQKSHTFSLE
jgi:hypothetical protein